MMSRQSSHLRLLPMRRLIASTIVSCQSTIVRPRLFNSIRISLMPTTINYIWCFWKILSFMVLSRRITIFLWGFQKVYCKYYSQGILCMSPVSPVFHTVETVIINATCVTINIYQCCNISNIWVGFIYIKDYDLNKTGYFYELKGCESSYLNVGIKLPFVMWYLETRQVCTLQPMPLHIIGPVKYLNPTCTNNWQ